MPKSHFARTAGKPPSGPAIERTRTARDPRAQPEWDGRVPRLFFAALAPQPVIAERLLGLCGALMQQDAVAPRTRELVALRTSATLECPYTWCGHVPLALGVGLSKTEIAGVAAGAAAFVGHDALVLQGVDELLGDGRMSSSTRTALGDDAVSVTVATGVYQIIAWLMGGVDPEHDLPWFAGLESPARARDAYPPSTPIRGD